MKESHIKTIKGFYDENAEFTRNERYSDSSQTVYTKSEDKYQWLVMKPVGADAVEIHQTDEQGIITARDNYQSHNNTIQCVSMERLAEHSRKMIPFDMDEADLLYQFGEGGKDGTLAMLQQIVPRIKDTATKELVKETIDKIHNLAPEVCSNLISFVKCRKIYERDHSIKERLANAQKQVKSATINEQKQRKKKEQSL